MKSRCKGIALILAMLMAAQVMIALPTAFSEAEVSGAVTISAAGARRENTVDSRMLIMPASLKEVGEDAFAGTAAEHILLSDVTETLADRAFESMRALTSVYLPDSLRMIGQGVFDGRAEAYFLGNSGSFAETWAKASGMDYSGARVRRIALESRRSGELILSPRTETMPGAENESETISPTPRMRAEGIRESRPTRRGDRAEMNHLVGLFP